MEKSNTYNYAKNEFDLMEKIHSDEKEDDKPAILEFKEEILALVDKFGHSGQSGGSAPYVAEIVANAVKDLCLQKPIMLITGDESEWVEVSKDLFQNKRCSGLFKSKDGVYYLDAIVFKDQENSYFSGSALDENGKEILSRQFIKGFPFEPKTFYIEVEKKYMDIVKGKKLFENYIQAHDTLNPVFEYYEKK